VPRPFRPASREEGSITGDAKRFLNHLADDPSIDERQQKVMELET
jgi:hypothetical protein